MIKKLLVSALLIVVILVVVASGVHGCVTARYHFRITKLNGNVIIADYKYCTMEYETVSCWNTYSGRVLYATSNVDILDKVEGDHNEMER